MPIQNKEHVIFAEVIDHFRFFSKDKWGRTCLIYMLCIIILAILLWVSQSYLFRFHSRQNASSVTDPNSYSQVVCGVKVPVDVYPSFIDCANLANSANAVLAIAFALFVYFTRGNIIKPDQWSKIIKNFKSDIRADIEAARGRGKVLDFKEQDLIAFADLNVQELQNIEDVVVRVQKAVAFIEFLVAFLIVVAVVFINTAALISSPFLWKIGFDANALFVLHMLLMCGMGFYLSNVWRKTWGLRERLVADYFTKYLESCKQVTSTSSTFFSNRIKDSIREEQ